jgi:hypothetical protein
MLCEFPGTSNAVVSQSCYDRVLHVNGLEQ